MFSPQQGAVTEWRYTASSTADVQGFYKVSEISTRHNAKRTAMALWWTKLGGRQAIFYRSTLQTIY